MATEQKNHTFLEVLRLKHTELWESKLNHFSLVGRGDLQILYSHALDLILLKINDNTWVLDKDLQLIGTRSIRGEWQAYSIVSPGGFHCLKITGLNFMAQQHPELVNFEAIVENRANFIRNTSLESRFDLFKEAHKSTLGNVTESLKNMMGSITSSIAHSDYTNHPNYQIVRPLNELLSVESTVVPVVDIPESMLNNYQTETNMLRDYQGHGEWKVLWDAGNNEYLHGFSKMSLDDTKSPGQQQFQGLGQQQFQGQSQFQNIPQGNITRFQNEGFGSQSGSQQEGGFEKLRSGELGYHQAPPGKHYHDAQEIVGGEEQRLPSYEVDESKQQHLDKGFEKAGSNIQGDTAPEKLQKDDSQFTTGLLRNDIEPPSNIQPSPKTPYHINELNNPPQKMKPLPEAQERVDLPKEALELKSWGSNVTNPSETTPTLENDLKAEFRSFDNRTNMDKINSEGDNMKETAAP